MELEKKNVYIIRKLYKQKIKCYYGLIAEHIIANAFVPIHYEDAFVPINYNYTKSMQEKDHQIEKDLQAQSLKDQIFWDGDISSNTPLRDVMQSSRDQ